MSGFLSALQTAGWRIVLFVATTLTAAAVARSPGASEPEANKGASSTSPVENPGRVESTLAGGLGVLDFDAADYAAINSNPDIRALIREADLQGEFDYYEKERIPRDAIDPVYSPEFVTPAEATLRPKELVMGLEINGDARAYPVGMMPDTQDGQ